MRRCGVRVRGIAYLLLCGGCDLGDLDRVRVWARVLPEQELELAAGR